MKECIVYWYHLPEHTDIGTQGYVGITCNPRHRDLSHKRYASGATILQNAFAKHGEEGILKKVMFKGTVEECMEREFHYRPLKNIGWNIAIGGGVPPDPTGRKHSQTTRDQIRESNLKTKALRPEPVSPFKGRTDRWNDEQKKLIGACHKGKVISEKHIEAIKLKLSGSNNYKAQSVTLVHKDSPEKEVSFGSMVEAAKALGIVHSSLRAQFQRKSKGYNRKGWKILYKVEG